MCEPGAAQASIAMGQVVGVAKEASLVALKVLDCEGQGTVADVVAGTPQPALPPSPVGPGHNFVFLQQQRFTSFRALLPLLKNDGLFVHM